MINSNLFKSLGERLEQYKKDIIQEEIISKWIHISDKMPPVRTFLIYYPQNKSIGVFSPENTKDINSLIDKNVYWLDLLDIPTPKE